MTSITKIDMKQATRLTREGRLQEAMDLLRGGSAPATTPASSPPWTLSSIAGDFKLKGAGAMPAMRMPAMNGGAKVTPVAAGATFEERAFGNAAGSRAYKLYVPSRPLAERRALVVMLHGCTQDPDDFALGTRMNDVAEEQGFLVVYPAQPQSANMSKCWNWFSAGEQTRDAGEPSLIAGITREIMQEFGVNSDSVFVAGLSAGGAAASIMGATYPDLYAGVGVHSGLACGAARDMPSAFSAMKQGAPGRGGSAAVPTIVFHGDRDNTVNPVNGDNVIAQSKGRAAHVEFMTEGEVGGMRYTRTDFADQAGRVVHEQWLLHGAGHAWSGGSESGSYADPRGPDASREMMRFFLSHKH